MAEKRIEPIKLTPEMETILREIGPDMTLLEMELAKAKRAGLDVNELIKRYEELKVLRTGILREYT